MKGLLYKSLFILILLGSFDYKYSFAQEIFIPKQWDKTFGSPTSDELTALLTISSNEFLLGGYKISFGYWVIKIDSLGNKIWEKVIKTHGGGGDHTTLTSMLATPDGGFLLGGNSSKDIGYDKSENSKGGYDYWIVKIDAQGNKIWDKTLGGSGADYLKSMLATPDGGFLLGGNSNSDISGDKSENNRGNFDYMDYWIVKIDAQGNKVWDKTLGGSGADYFKSMLATSDGRFLLGGYSNSSNRDDKSDNTKGSWDYWIIKIDAQGNKIWDKTLGGNSEDFFSTILPISTGGFLLGGFSYSAKGDDKSENSKGSYDYWIVKIDAQGNKIWDKTLGGNRSDVLTSMLISQDDCFIVGGYSESDLSEDKGENGKGNNDYWIIKIDSKGNKIWDRTFGGNGKDELNTMLSIPNGGIMLGGLSLSNKSYDKSENSQGLSDYWVIKLGKEILTPNRVSGTVFLTSDSNCNYVNKIPLIGWIIKAEPGPYYAITNSLGKYNLFLGKNTYNITQIPPVNNSFFTFKNQNCPLNPHIVTFNTFAKDTSNINFGLDVNVCAILKVDVSSTIRRRCFNGQTIITYQNEGLIKTDDVHLEVDFPESIIPLSSSVPWTSQKGRTLTYKLGTLYPGEQKKIIIIDSVTCIESVRGITQCIEARIWPKNTCASPHPNWSGASLGVWGKCLSLAEPKAQIVIKNVGEDAMIQASKYRIFTNDSLLLSSYVHLIAGDSLILEVPMRGFDVYVEVEQVEYHPNPELLSIYLANCKFPTSSRLVNQYPLPDGNPEKEIDCQRIVDSFDPNDKLVSPEGITENHYVKPDTRLEYTLRFQNTGTAEAINIQVVDTLTSNLNFESFEMVSSSHPYQLEVKGSQKQILIFKFPNINLPDSTSNEPLSHGFIKFKISPKPNLPEGTIVSNFADIYFDYNEPVRTNITKINYTNYQFPQVESLTPCEIKGYAPPKPKILQIGNENKLICDINDAHYQWYRNGSLITQNTQNITINQSGEYGVIVRKNNCISEISALISIDICKTDYFFLKKPTITQGNNANELKVDISGASYQWFRNGILIPQNTQVIKVNQSGEYEAIIHKNGCISEKSNTFPFTITALNEFEKQTYVSFYPNPSSGDLNLKITNTLDKGLNLRILQINGKVILQRKFQANMQKNWETTLDLNHISQGVYFLEVEHEKGKFIKKIVIIK